jgi:glucan biosynthesis protein C
MRMTSTSKPAGGRHYGMDWLRIGAFGLLIFYHVGLVFSPWPYEVKSNRTFDWVAVPMLALNAWRLSLLFAISGYASAALFARETSVGSFVRSRLARLGVPLLFGIAVIVPPQPWIALIVHRGYAHGYGHFFVHDYFLFASNEGLILPTWMHLWFVVYLLIYTGAMALLLALPDGLRAALRRAAEWLLAGPGLLPIPILCVFIARQYPPGWNEIHDVVHDGATHLAYGGMFAIGWLLRGSHGIQRAIARQWPAAALLALLAYALVAAFEIEYPADTPLPGAEVVPFHIARAVQGWCAIVALFGMADRYWNHDAPWRAMLAEAVFPFYIIHQTIIIVAGYWLVGLALPVWFQFVLLVATTAAGCWVFYLVGRTIGPLRPLIGLSRRAKPKEAVLAAA